MLNKISKFKVTHFEILCMHISKTFVLFREIIYKNLFKYYYLSSLSLSIWFFLLLWFPFSMTYAIVRPRSETSEDKDSWMRLLLVLFVNVQTCTLSCFRKLKKKIYMTFHLTCPLPSAWKDFKSHSLRRKRSLKLFHHMSRCLFFFCFRKDLPDLQKM